MHVNQSIVVTGDTDFQFERIHCEDVLAPGYYWRLKNNFSITSESHGQKVTLHSDDVHLLLEIFEHDGVAHTVTILCHPRQGSRYKYKILVAEFLANFEPEKDADAIRAREQADVMHRVMTMQEEMAQAQVNPLSLPGMKEAIDKAVDKFEQQQAAEIIATSESQEQRVADLRKLHRRAARRSTAAGNPLTVRSLTISDKVGLMIAGGVDSQGLQELTAEAKKRIVVAETTSKWLITKTEEISQILKELTPYYAEKGEVALARASKAISYVKEITKGLQSLKLYTGDGVDVVPVVEGLTALSSEPLTLVQGKRYMDEELAVWADVDNNFDWRSQPRFFDALKETPELVKQIFPTQRCVVSVAVTRRKIEYSREISGWESMRNEIRNRSVFLLVRDGENIYAVYSIEPSHEAAIRLFPTQSEIEGPFKGIDGSKIGLQDVAFGESVDRFNDVSLHYKRFLILLCGLDHRMRLFGDFYPHENSLDFMTIEFQSRYFRFLEDDDASLLIGNDLDPVDEWMMKCNKVISSGSRVVIAKEGFSACSPQLQRAKSIEVDFKANPDQFIVARVKKNHCISVATYSRWADKELGQKTAVVWLDGPECKVNNWYLCMDSIRLDALQRYIYSRTSRIANIAWLRAFKKAEAILKREHQQQAALRQVLTKSALENKILSECDVVDAIELALSAWRAAHKGSDAPATSDTKAVHELLTLMFPVDRLAQSTESMVDSLVEKFGFVPLKLCRTGKTRLVLYVQASQQDKEIYSSGVHFGWVKRVLIDVMKTKLSIASTSLVWLQKIKPDASELTIRTWPALDVWEHACGEPCSLKSLELMRNAMAQTEGKFASLLAEGRSAPCRIGIDAVFFEKIMTDAIDRYSSMKYCTDVPLVLPVGVLQHKSEYPDKCRPALFLYGATNAYAFLSRYGSEDQIKQYQDNVILGRFYRTALARMIGDLKPPVWRLIETKMPFKRCVLNGDETYTIPNRVQVNRNKSGGLKKSQRRDIFSNKKSTRAIRRSLGGDPRHQHETLTLSWNRSVESILGLAPHLKHDFHKESRKWSSSFYGQEKKVFDPGKPSHFDFSSLIWNPSQNRSHANKYFSVQR